MSAGRHWPPRKGDEVWSGARERAGLNPYGVIFALIRDWDIGMHEARVKFPGNKVEYRKDQCIRINGILYPYTITLLNPLFCVPKTTDYESIDFDILDGNWSSSENGEGQWSLE